MTAIKNAVSVGLLLWGGVTLARLVGQIVAQRRARAYQRRFAVRLQRRLAEERAKEIAGWCRTRRDGVWIDKRHTP